MSQGLTQPDGLLRAGKLPHALLEELLASLPNQDPQLIVGPSVGEDAAVIDFAPGRQQLLVAKSDPITFATDAIGYYAVNVCANDLAVCGATPRFYFPTVLLPAGRTDVALVHAIFAQIGSACRSLGVVVAGGHSEVTPAVQQPVVAGSMLGEVPAAQLVRSGGAMPGDVILLAGAAPIEGVSLIAREKRQELLARGWSAAELDMAAGYLYSPGISVLAPALQAASASLVTAMHDPTEGGIATGLLEMALASGTGMMVDVDAIPVDALARPLCAAFGLDPLGTIASGALLAAARPEKVPALQAAWAAIGWSSAVIGQVAAPSAGLRARRSGQEIPFPTFAVDEITRLWA